MPIYYRFFTRLAEPPRAGRQVYEPKDRLGAPGGSISELLHRVILATRRDLINVIEQIGRIRVNAEGAGTRQFVLAVSAR
jgi:hypothetical protein